MNQSHSQQSLAFDKDRQFDYLNKENNFNTCIPRYQLVRIKHTEPFSREYVLRVKNKLSLEYTNVNKPSEFILISNF
jgi:hypothetical protein